MSGSLLLTPEAGGQNLNFDVLGVSAVEFDFDPKWDDWDICYITALLLCEGGGGSITTASIELKGVTGITEVMSAGHAILNNGLSSFNTNTQISLPRVIRNATTDDLYVSRLEMWINKGTLTNANMYGSYRISGSSASGGVVGAAFGSFKVQWSGTMTGLTFATNSAVLFTADMCAAHSYGIVRRK